MIRPTSTAPPRSRQDGCDTRARHLHGRRYRVIAVLLVALASGVGSARVEAHAALVDSDPAAGARLDRSPVSIRLVFNERVEPGFNSVRVLDPTGTRHEQGGAHVREDGSVVEIDVDGLATGRYIVVWRVNSIDGHQVRGYFGFGVGTDPPDEPTLLAAAITRTAAWWGLYVGTWRMIALVAITVWLGGLAFVAFVLAPRPPGTRAGPSVAATARLQRLTTVAGLVFLVAELVAFCNHASVLADVTMVEAVAPPVLRIVLTGTNYGFWWIVRFVTAVTLLVWCVRAGSPVALLSTSGRRVGVGCLAGLALLTWPLTGHAGGVATRMPLAVGIDWLHLIATTTWIGGLIALVTLATAAPRDEEATAALPFVPQRFSRLALVCVCVLAVTGAYNAVLHLPDVASFTGTEYGRVLLAKLVLIAVVLAVASMSRRRVARMTMARRPQETGAVNWGRNLRRLASAEVILLLPVLGLVVWLTSVPPATVSGTGGHFESTKEHGGFLVTLIVHPATVGTNHIVVTASPGGQPPVGRVNAVTVFVRPLDVDAGLQTVETALGPNGAFTATAVQASAGRARVSVQVSPAGADAFLVEFDVHFAM